MNRKHTPTPRLPHVPAALLVLASALVLPVSVHAETGYQDGRSGYSWLGFRSSASSSNGYSSSGGGINRPHRSDWKSKLNAMRKYEAYVRKQQAGRNTAACGFTGAPSYCYRLIEKPRYPAEYRIVRY